MDFGKHAHQRYYLIKACRTNHFRQYVRSVNSSSIKTRHGILDDVWITHPNSIQCLLEKSAHISWLFWHQWGYCVPSHIISTIGMTFSLKRNNLYWQNFVNWCCFNKRGQEVVQGAGDVRWRWQCSCTVIMGLSSGSSYGKENAVAYSVFNFYFCCFISVVLIMTKHRRQRTFIMWRKRDEM